MLAPVVRGGAAGVRALLKRARGHSIQGSLAKAAERFLRRHVELEDASPFNAAPAARAEHAARLSEAQVVRARRNGCRTWGLRVHNHDDCRTICANVNNQADSCRLSR